MSNKLDAIKKIYEIRDEKEYLAFVKVNPKIPRILLNLGTKIPTYFDDIQKIELVVQDDPEIPGLSTLDVFIRVSDRGKHNRRQYLNLLGELPDLAPKVRNLFIFI